MEKLALTPRVEGVEIIPQRLADGYISETALCQSVGKRFTDYRTLKGKQEFINELSAKIKLGEDQLIHIILGGDPKGIKSKSDLSTLLNFLSCLNKTFKHSVSLTHGNSREEFFEY
ncbi:hypothetical protein GBO14_19105 [Pseudoalteromonas shioyasakiensis]|uniref:KilA-N domain-containing protein n=1 Tax=Pseudoalteromonas shioyasakiensis TaxID=1190813 RepID=UPI002094A70D|nr:KilA-N domain-containing protein [Pseudoalteromonas shioyasakiensis]MCO6356824.1 hypothetical protein [Pseudoalteromonas shioyasakiensis]